MDSRTKRRLSRQDLEYVTGQALGSPLREAAELTGGTFNAAYRLVSEDGQSAIVKAAPTDPAVLLTHEHGLLETEVLFYKQAARAGVPVPRVLYTDWTREHVGSEVLVMSEVAGTAWNLLTPDAAAGAALRRQLGFLAARIHTVTGTVFGYPATGTRLRATTWPAAFALMTEALLADADRYEVRVPAGILDAVTARQGDLAEVTTPALVHFDLWPGNIFIAGDAVTGLIDGERALWADPLAEFASLTIFSELDADPDLLAGYAAGAGLRLETGHRAAVRLTLYRMYLDLIMIIEGVPRGYTGPDRERFEDFIREHLDAQLARLRH